MSDVTKISFLQNTGITSEVNNTSIGCRYWQLDAIVTGFGTISYQFETSKDGVTWTVPAIIHTGTNPTTITDGASSSYIGYFPFVRVNVTAVTGQGSITITLNGFQQVPSPVPPGGWNVFSAPASGTQALATKAAVPGVRHVLTALTFSAITGTVAPAATTGTVGVFDGATVVAVFNIVIPATAAFNATPIVLNGLNIIGSPNTAMTVNFLAGITNVFEAITMYGYDTTQ
jgi:hypothetical protein